MKEIISLQFKYTEAEYVAAIRLYMRRSPDFIIRLVVCALYVIVSISLLVLLAVESDVLVLFVAATFIPPVLAFMGYFAQPRYAFRREPKFRDEYFLQFSDDGIHFRTAQIDSLVQWSLYDKVIEDERFYLMVYGKNMISVTPKRAFTSAAQEAAFRELLARHLPGGFDAKRLAERVPETSYVPPAGPPDWR